MQDIVVLLRGLLLFSRFLKIKKEVDKKQKFTYLKNLYSITKPILKIDEPFFSEIRCLFRTSFLLKMAGKSLSGQENNSRGWRKRHMEGVYIK